MTPKIKKFIQHQFHQFLSPKLPQLIAILGIVTAVLFWGIGSAIASDAPDPLTVPSPASQATPNRPTLDTNTIPSAKVSQFVGAYLQVLRQIEGREQELLSAPTSLESQRIEREIETASIKAIAQAGLTKQEYL
ncbi:MAG: DUF4168 domain-containing protein, partial [Chroococcales cyanobacterium]